MRVSINILASGPSADLDKTVIDVLLNSCTIRPNLRIIDQSQGRECAPIVDRVNRMIRSKLIPASILRIDYLSDPSGALNDKMVCADLDAADRSGQRWIGFLLPGDRLYPGALDRLKALGQSTSEECAPWVWGARTLAGSDVDVYRPTPKILRNGLCDGVHFPEAGVSGCFFRLGFFRDLTARASLRHDLGDLGYNIVRSAALVSDPVYCAPLVATQSLGEREDQLLSLFGAVEWQAPAEYRRSIFTASGSDSDRSIVRYQDGALEKAVLSFGWKNFFEANWSNRGAVLKRRLEAGRRNFEPYSGEICGLFACDFDWQWPAKTEQHAYNQLKVRGLVRFTKQSYIAFPWATLFDRWARMDPRASSLTARLRDMVGGKAFTGAVLTVCQHIDLRKFIGILEMAGVTDVYWSHAIKGEDTIGSVRVHPFPLFPVQYIRPASDRDWRDRAILFSFAGAKANNYYLSKVRTHILETLASADQGVVKGRDAWHYNKFVYEMQIGAASGEDQTIALENGEQSDASAEGVEFRELLKNSKFALCPSGTGPNSIRLWEAIGSGSIPVVLAETWRAPGSMRLWREAVLFCEETEEAVAALPERLEQLAADEEAMHSMRRALEQLWFLYGSESFVTDIELHIRNEASRVAAQSLGAPSFDGGKRKVHLFGKHSSRTPFAHATYQPYFEKSFEFVSAPEKADLIITGFDKDFIEDSKTVIEIQAKNPRAKFIILSEEPMWDLIWARSPYTRNSELDLGEGQIKLTTLNHFTSRIFHHDRIPYALTVKEEIRLRATYMLRRFIGGTAKETVARWTSAPRKSAFAFDRREGESFSVSNELLGVYGLADYRSRLADRLSGPGSRCLGAGWPSGRPAHAAPDGHLERLLALNGEAFLASAIEHTQYDRYVSENVVDTLATGAMPMYLAGQNHRVHELIGEDAFINLNGLSPEEAADRISDLEPTLAMADAWLEAVHRISSLLRDDDALDAERRRLVIELVAELDQLQL